MAKILGLDLGTNSIGWAVVEKEDGQFSLVDKGVRIFQEGVKIEKGIESSKAADRTEHRSARRIKYRRKLRKIETLKVLSEYGYCPNLSKEELDLWRFKKVYPQNINFRNWWLTDDEKNKHPYFFRHLAITQKLDLNKESDKQKIGRAFYHIAQRRGFLSNRLDSTPENETGKVKSSIKELQEKKGDRTLGQYFYEDCYLKGIKIRDQYTHREDDYLDEFNRICEFQNIPQDIQKKLYKAIFYQRPLKSQKGLIGKCVFEPNKPRCSVSRPEFEEYRMLCFINNIKTKAPEDEKLRSLTEKEKQKIIPQFFRKSKEHFDFEDIAKQLAPKKQYKFYKDRNINQEDYLFNFSMKTTVSGCPVSARFKELFAEEFIDEKFNYTKNDEGKTPKIINDFWHALYTFDSDKKLTEYTKKHIDFDEEQTQTVLKIRLKQDFASLSLKAINKILPYLRDGLIYSHAVFLANMEETVPSHIWQDKSNRALIKNEINQIIINQNDDKLIINTVNGFITNAQRNNEVWSDEAQSILFQDLEKKLIDSYGRSRYKSFSDERKQNIKNKSQELLSKHLSKKYGKGEHIKAYRIDEAVQTFLKDNFGSIKTEKIYHPSAIETYKPPKRADDGKLYLGSPMTSSVRNPMAMRALHQLRIVVNELIKEGIIDNSTKINIEMSRGLLNANERTGLKKWQDNREKKRKEYISKIEEFFNGEYVPSEDEILKYQLWEEQNHICLYSGKTINLEDFLGANPKFDIEHTIPRSQSYDNSQENKTLCDNIYNRQIKKNKIPFETPNYTEILPRIEHWKKEIEKSNNEIEKTVRQAKGAADKAQKDRAIQKRHQLSYERNYWRNKYKRFIMEEVPDGFKNSQMVDIGIITKYSRLYLKTVFPKVYTVKGNTVADFRKLWGLQNTYGKKARVNHVHHCIDAITIACMDKSNYETLAKFYHESENAFQRNNEETPYVKKPWITFTEDVKAIENEILVSHYTADNLHKQSKKKLRKRGEIQYNKQGKTIYQQGDSVRGSLHKDTFYGAIEREITDKKGVTSKQIKYVVRKSLNDIEDSALKNIVDDRVREIVTNARKAEKSLQKEIDSLTKKRQKAEEWDEIEIDKQIAEFKDQIAELYSLPNKNGAPIPIKKVRIYQPTVTNPLHIKAQRDKSTKSKKEYKEHYHVANDGNYLMAIYEGKDSNEKTIRDFELVNNIDAGEYFKRSVQKDLEGQGIEKFEGLIPKTKIEKNTQLQICSIIKIGTLVILWKNNPEEIWDMSKTDRNQRLYVIRGIDLDGIKLYYHQEARPTTDVISYMNEVINNENIEKNIVDKNGKIKISKLSTPKGGIVIDKANLFPYIKFKASNFNALIEGVDFKITPIGKIIKIEQ